MQHCTVHADCASIKENRPTSSQFRDGQYIFFNISLVKCSTDKYATIDTEPEANTGEMPSCLYDTNDKCKFYCTNKTSEQATQQFHSNYAPCE